MNRQEQTAISAARRAACPGFYRMPNAADGHLCRIKLPLGIVQLKQLAAIADLAEKYGNGNIELTTRGNLQLRGVQSGNETALSAALAAAGLAPAAPQADDIRNIMVNPVPARRTVNGANALHLAENLLAMLQSEPRFQRLSPKFAFYIDGGEACFISRHSNDIWLSFLPAEFAEDGAPLCLIGLASPLPNSAADIAALCLGLVRQNQALAALRALLSGFADAAEQNGLRRMRDWLAQAGLPAIRAAVCRLAPDLDLRPADAAEAQALAAYFAARCPNDDFAVIALALGLRPIEAGAAEYYCGIAPKFGRFSAASLRRFASLAAAHLPQAALRANGWQSLIFSPLSRAAGQQAVAAFADAGFITDSASPYAHLLCCAGLPHCARARADVQTDAAFLAQELESHYSGLKSALGIIHLTACPKSCAASCPQDMTLLAAAPGLYDIYQAAPDSAGKFGRLLASGLSRSDILPFLSAHFKQETHALSPACLY